MSGEKILTVDQVNEITGDDIAFWLGNPFLTPDMLIAKVCWWMTQAATPAPVPSEVAEATAGEREVEALFDCSCGHSIAEHNGLGCYARLSYTPLVTCECPLTDDRTHGELLAPRLAALLDRVRREEGERIAQAIEAQRDVSQAPNYRAGFDVSARIARAASVGRGEGL